MPVKGRCGKCQAHLHCRGNADTCCKCIPLRLCVAIYPPASSAYCNLVAPDDDPYGPALIKTFHWDCSLSNYFGVFRINDIDVPLTFAFLKDNDGNCWFTLESDCLGYSFEFGYDNRLKLPMPGSYTDIYDGQTRVCACANPDYEFTANLTPCVGGCGNVRIKVTVADYQPEPDPQIIRRATDPYKCYCECICITLTTPDGEVYRQTTCLADGSNEWAAQWDYIGTVLITRESAEGDPTILSMVSPYGNGEPIFAICTCREKMFAEWDLGAYGSVKVTCAPNQGCIDCRCWCRCVCITYFDDHVMRIARACWDADAGSWSASFLGRDYDETEVTIKLVCDARIGTTYLRLTSNLGSPDDVPAQCPEISGTWNLTKPDYSPVTISIACDTCGICQKLGQVSPCGCYDFIPETLYATFAPNAIPPQPPAARDKSCDGAGGVVPIRFDTDLQCWIGSGLPFAGCSTRIWVKMTCADNTPGNGKMKLSVGLSLAEVLTEGGENKPPVANACEPFEVAFESFHFAATDACCQTTSGPFDITDSNAYDIIITE